MSKLDAGPHYMHIILCGGLSLSQDRRAVKEGESRLDADAGYLVYHQMQHHGGLMKKAYDSVICVGDHGGTQQQRSDSLKIHIYEKQQGGRDLSPSAP